MEKQPLKSHVRYTKMKNDLSPLWAPSDLGSLKRNTYATFCSRLHSRSTPSDSERKKGSLLTTKCPCCIVDFGMRVVQRNLAWFGAGTEPTYRACLHDYGTFTKANSLKLYITYYISNILNNLQYILSNILYNI